MQKRFLLTAFLLLGTALVGFAQERIILLNEGNWQADNGKMTYFEDGVIVSNEWFREVNGYKLGDTPNDIIQVNDSLIAIAINWSNIIQFITPEGKAVAATEDVPNNRKLCSDGRYVYVSSYGHECGAYGTDRYWEFEKGYVAKIDITDFQIVDAVEVGYEPEGIALYKGKLFVANTGGYAFQENHEYETTVSIIDAETMQLERNVDTEQINLYGKMSQSGQYLCINSPGDYYDIQAATIILDCEKALAGDDECFVKLEYACTYNCTAMDGRFYAIGSRYSYYTSDYEFNYITIDPVMTMENMNDAGVEESLPGQVLHDIQAMTMPYGIYVNPYTGYIYATDAGGFVSAGTMYQWNPEGQLTGKYKVYINPAHFLALRPDAREDGLQDVMPDGNRQDMPICDLFGRRILQPAKGQIYIRGGRKYIIEK